MEISLLYHSYDDQTLDIFELIFYLKIPKATFTNFENTFSFT